MAYSDFTAKDLTRQFGIKFRGARKLNEAEGNSFATLYGCSTTGIEWRFLKFEQTEIIIDEKRYLITELPKLLAILQAIVDQTRTEVAG